MVFLMMKFEKFNDDLWIAKGENFVAWLEREFVYCIDIWGLHIRERNCIHEKELGRFYPKYSISTGIAERDYKRSVLSKGFEEKEWDNIIEIISYSEKVLDARGFT